MSSALRELAVELGRIANDLRLLASGPTTGLGEIALPEVQPGSSIMPGKSNPVMAECLNMICYEVIGNDQAIMMASQAGQLELNVMTPLITAKLLDSISLLNSYLPTFEDRCLSGITADEERCSKWLGSNPILVTHLAPRIGYLEGGGDRQGSDEQRSEHRGPCGREKADEQAGGGGGSWTQGECWIGANGRGRGRERKK